MAAATMIKPLLAHIGEISPISFFFVVTENEINSFSSFFKTPSCHKDFLVIELCKAKLHSLYKLCLCELSYVSTRILLLGLIKSQMHSLRTLIRIFLVPYSTEPYLIRFLIA